MRELCSEAEWRRLGKANEKWHKAAIQSIKDKDGNKPPKNLEVNHIYGLLVWDL